MEDHPRLREEVGQRRHGENAGVMVEAGLREHLDSEEQPGRAQRRVIPHAAALRGWLIAAEEPVVARDQQREHHRGLLGEHGSCRCKNADRQPADTPLPCDGAGECRQREQAEHPCQRLQSLVDVCHGLCVQGMHRPESGDARRKDVGMAAIGAAEARRGERGSCEKEQRHRRADVDEEIGDVVTERPLAPEGVIDRKRQVGERTRRQTIANEHHSPGRPWRIHQRVIEDLRVVVHQKLAVERVEKGSQGAADDEQGGQPRDGSRIHGGHAVCLVHAHGEEKADVARSGAAV